ncbi:NADH-quinone oxidoreductase subunit L [Methanoregula sp.]|uniref:NADH-quinone oxidoreductase subunit 5 family protein n=1 Tax=Methanoregula sp. TaxID=2052170 RepID=UPI002BA3C952|nr:proton-conducting transporter membrane subunit [Methanoregula sp.]HVP95719.1 proton-conducting transporter membrane subunit [Methanoregula sp.]
MQFLLFLILFPLISALFMLAVRRDVERGWIVKLSALALGAVTVLLLVTQFDKGTLYFGFDAEPVNLLMFVLEMVISVIILWFAVRFRNYLVIALTLVETALILWFETAATPAIAVKTPLFLDQFSIIMALIIGIIGSLICVYSLGYMRHFYQHHTGIPDRTNTFFIIIFVFLSAMFGLVFSNSLIWVFFFWEVTTLCSFLLIGFTKTEEATKNAFTALWMNLLGGIAFAGAIVYLTYQPAGMLGLDQVLVSGKALVLIPAALVGFAGLTKAAQMPFSSWLVGAMVAPTPVSALLHSSTMVKAGVYILVRFAPAFQGTTIGYTLAFVGAFTFLIASGMAISQSNAKRVLAYSTIANLGLVTACAGIGTYEAIWAAILLIIFHAISKSLMFLSVGTVEHRIRSREIEDMNGLIVRMPRIAAIMVIGIAGMFLAPFGMLISKWAAIQAFIDAPFGLVFVVILVFGSALTLFFWAKWMGKLLVITPDAENVEGLVDRNEWIALVSLAGLTVVTCFIFPLISATLIEPFLLANYGSTAQLAQDNIIIMIMMLFLIVLLPLSILLPHRKQRILPPYMGGVETARDMHFQNALGARTEMKLANYYVSPWFGEAKLATTGVCLCSILIVIMFAAAVTGGGAFL